MNVAITWHRKDALSLLLKEQKIKYDDFINVLDHFILNNFDKEQDIFYVWWSDWFDNIISDILIKNWYKYILKLSEKDKGWREYWNKDDIDLFNRIKNNAIQIETIPWSYIKRDYELIKKADKLIMFINPWKIGKSWTWTTFELFIKENIEKNINISNIKKDYSFLKIINLL